mgnify:FL=1|jgi:uncharacterized membrane protein YdbT with pleckstrin-like domain
MEGIVWERKPSQLINVSAYVIWSAMIAAIFVLDNISYQFVADIHINVYLKLLNFFQAYPVLPFLFVIPVLVIAKKYLDIAMTSYTLTDERIIVTDGILNRDTHDLEIYRIKDYEVYKPFLLRIFGRGIVMLDTSDRTHPTLALLAITEPELARDDIRFRVESLRSEKGVREFD